MHQFVLQRGKSAELRLFPHISELGIKKNGAIQLNTFLSTATDDIRLYYITEGKFGWRIDHQPYVLYPGDVALILPGVLFGSDDGVLRSAPFPGCTSACKSWGTAICCLASGAAYRKAKARYRQNIIIKLHARAIPVQ